MNSFFFTTFLFLQGPGSFFDEDIRSGTDPFADEMSVVASFLDREDVRVGLHAAPLSLKPSVASDGMLCLGGDDKWTNLCCGVAVMTFLGMRSQCFS